MSDNRTDNNDSNDSRNPEEIQRDIGTTQTKLADDLDELGYRASPERLKEQAAGRLEGVTGAAVDATEKAARDLVERAEAIGERAAARLRENPLPAALVGAAVGAGWLLTRASRGNRRDRDGSAQHTRPARVYTPDARGAAGRPSERVQAPRTAPGGEVMDTARAREAATLNSARLSGDTSAGGTMSQTGAPYNFETDGDHYKSHYEETFADSAHGYNHFERAYRFGAALPDYPDYSDRDWGKVSDDAKRDWERTNDAPWEEVREAVRFGWERGHSHR